MSNLVIDAPPTRASETIGIYIFKLLHKRSFHGHCCETYQHESTKGTKRATITINFTKLGKRNCRENSIKSIKHMHHRHFHVTE